MDLAKGLAVYSRTPRETQRETERGPKHTHAQPAGRLRKASL